MLYLSHTNEEGTLGSAGPLGEAEDQHMEVSVLSIFPI